MDDQRRTNPYRRLTVVAAGVLLLSACGAEDPEGVALANIGEDPQTTAESEPEAEQAADPEVTDEGSDAGAGDDAGDDAGDEAADELGHGGDGATTEGTATEEPEDALAVGACDLAEAEGTEPLDVDSYEQLTLETNFELELLVTDLAADLDELLSGVSDGPTLEDQLADHRAAYAAAVEPLRDVAPPEGATEWHDGAMGSFDAVCTAIEDGLAGSAEGDDQRFESFVAALTEFPGLLNRLHANAACGPFESC